VPTLGGDGRMHPVPVHWYDYTKLSKATPFIVQDLKNTRQEYMGAKNVFANRSIKNVYYQKGLVSALMNEPTKEIKKENK
ncbi:MAG: hypothetical protein MJ208_01615, partial [Bacilli bacterium]|nr:hypothetical protein [Bacilli bacterium]